MATINIGLIISATNRATGAVNAARRDVEGLGTSLRRIAQVMRAVQALFLVNQIAQWGRALVKTISDLQGMQVRLASVTGSFAKANEVLATLNQKFGASGQDVSVLAEGWVRLQGAGLGFEKTAEVIDALGNAVAAFGGTGQELQRAVIGISQVVGKGTLQMEEMKQQIGEAVPVAMRIMANAAGVSVAQFQANITKGMYSSEQAVQFFIDGSKKAFGNFASLMGSTLPGSIARISAEFNAGLLNILKNTTLDEGLTAIFNTIAEAVKDFMASIDQSTVDKFFAAMESIYQLFVKIGPALLAIIEGLGALASMMLTIVNSMPDWAVQGLGLLALFLFGGPVGATLAGIGAVMLLIDKLGISFQEMWSAIKSILPKGLLFAAIFNDAGMMKYILQNISTIYGAIMEGAATVIGWFDSQMASRVRVAGALAQAKLRQMTEESQSSDPKSIFSSGTGDSKVTGYEASIKAITENLVKLSKMTKIPEAINDGFKQGAAAAERLATKIAHLRLELKETLEDIENKIKILGMELSGDKLGLALAQVNKEYDDQAQKIEKAIQKATELNKLTHDQDPLLKKLAEDLLLLNEYRAVAITQTTELVALEREQTLLAEKQEQLKIRQQIFDAKRAADTSFGGNFMAQTEGGRAVLDIYSQQFELQQSIADTEEQILANKLEMIKAEGDHATQIMNTIALLEQFKEVQSQALADLSTTAKFTAQLYSDIGSAISGSVGQALTDLAHGTLDLKKVMNSLWESITNAVVKYIQKIIEAQIQQMLLNALGGGGSFLGGGAGAAGGAAGGFSMFGGFAQGAAFKGGVKMFANGDIIRGPTMFGMAGEEGDEAIMPLTRIGGRLGVLAQGHGGDNFHIDLRAIDTQSGIEFLIKHIPQLQAMLQQRALLNRGMALS